MHENMCGSEENMQRRKKVRMERTHLFLPDAVIVMKAEIYPNQEKFRELYQKKEHRSELLIPIREAIMQASLANETLHSRLCMDTHGEVWYEAMKEPGTSCEICEADTDWKQLVAMQKRQPFDLKEGKLMRCFLIPRDHGVMLIVMMHHLAGDGKSEITFLQDVMSALNQKPLTSKPLSILKQSDLPHGTGLRLPVRRLVRVLNHAWKREGTVFGKQDYLRVCDGYWKQQEQKIADRIFTEKETEQIRQMAKQEGVTVHTFLTTAILKAYGKQAEVSYAVDVCGTARNGMGNFVSGQNFTAAYDDTDSFAGNMKQIHAVYQEKKLDVRNRYFTLRFLGALTPALIDCAAVQMYTDYDSEVGRTIAHLLGYDAKQDGVSISNLTGFHLSGEGDSYRMRDLLFVPPMIPYDSRLFGIVTLENRLGLTLHYREGEIDGERLLDQVAWAVRAGSS